MHLACSAQKRTLKKTPAGHLQSNKTHNDPSKWYESTTHFSRGDEIQRARMEQTKHTKIQPTELLKHNVKLVILTTEIEGQNLQ
jgi:hypothetical protein